MLGNVFILGDSYSTFSGHIPDGYEAYYTKNGPQYLKEHGLKLCKDDVIRVEETWWYDLVRENGNLLLNCSWSGTTICNTGYGGCDNSKISFIARFEKLLNEGFFEKNHVDTFILFGGTNDSWSDAPLGRKIYSDWTQKDLYNVFPAFSYLINKLTTNLPDTKIYCIINCGIKPEIAAFYKEICRNKKVVFIELSDIDKTDGHPTINGMAQIKNQILRYMR